MKHYLCKLYASDWQRIPSLTNLTSDKQGSASTTRTIKNKVESHQDDQTKQLRASTNGVGQQTTVTENIVTERTTATRGMSEATDPRAANTGPLGVVLMVIMLHASILVPPVPLPFLNHCRRLLLAFVKPCCRRRHDGTCCFLVALALSMLLPVLFAHNLLSRESSLHSVPLLPLPYCLLGLALAVYRDTPH